MSRIEMAVMAMACCVCGTMAAESFVYLLKWIAGK